MENFESVDMHIYIDGKQIETDGGKVRYNEQKNMSKGNFFE